MQGLEIISDKITSKTYSCRSVLVCESKSPSDILDQTIDNGCPHIVQKDSSHFEKELKTSAKLAVDPELILKSPISSILSPSQITDEIERKKKIYSSQFSKADEKHDILDGLSSILDTRIKSLSLKTDLITIADELLTNALYNAPYITDLDPMGVSRKNPSAKMHDGKRGEFFCGSDDERIVLGCRDPYGSLDAMKLFTKIKNCYDTGVAENINMDERGGAGIGSYMVFNFSSSYYVVLDKGKITMVCSVLPLKSSNRSRKQYSKNLHYIYLNKGNKDGRV